MMESPINYDYDKNNNLRNNRIQIFSVWNG